MTDDRGWIGVDLDGTLAKYGDRFEGPTHIGEPVPKMLERVKKMLAEKKRVKVFTARVHSDQPAEQLALVRRAIDMWCLLHIGQTLEVTNVKDFRMRELWDDRAIQVEKNTGRRMDGLEEERGPDCNGVLVHAEYSLCPRCDR